jgi:tetratricopeptide (TPR) repeat protein
MSGGRWDPQTRIAVVVVGMLVVTIGALSTVQWRSGIGAAALVIGGLLVCLAGVAGGTIFGPRETPEIHIVTGEQAAGSAEQRAAAQRAAARQRQADCGEEFEDPAQVLILEAGPAPRAIPAQVSARITAARAAAARAAAMVSAGRTAPPIPLGTAGAAGPGSATAPGNVSDTATAASPELEQVARLLNSGNLEAATDFTVTRLQALAPEAHTYINAVLGALTTVLEGRVPRAATNQLLGPRVLRGPQIAIDIRPGAGFVPELVERTYRHLAEGLPPVRAFLVVVNATGVAETESLAQLRQVLERPVITVPWQLGEPTERLVEGFNLACGESRTRYRNPSSRRSESPAEQRVTQPPAPPPFDDSQLWQRASNLHWRGQLQEAEEAYRGIVETRGQVLGWDSPGTLLARDQHATVMRDLDRLAEALVECDEVLVARTRVLGPEHEETLTSRSHLATIYHQLGDLTRAEGEHQAVLKTRIRILGPMATDTLITRSNLAKVYQDLGELDRAIEEHTTVMRQRAQVLGAEHRDTLMSRSLLASAQHQAGRFDEAEAEHRAVLAGRLRELGPAHLDTAISRHRLASVLHDLHRLDEAIMEYETAREVYTNLLGAASPFSRAAASDLAMAQRALRGDHPAEPPTSADPDLPEDER